MSQDSSIIKEYSQLAKTYDEKYSLYIKRTTERHIESIRLRGTNSLLDIGCGTGVLLNKLSEIYPKAKLNGVDPVTEMLSIARKRLADNIELKNSWAEKLPYDDNSFDVISSCSMFHYIKNPKKAMGEIDRVLKPNGKLIITDWCRDYTSCQLYNIYMGLFNNAHIKIYNRKELTNMLKDLGFININSATYKIDWFWGIITITATKKNG